MTKLQILNITNLYILRVCAEMHPFIFPKKQLNRPEHNHNYTSVSNIHKHATRYATTNHQYITYTTEHFTAIYTRVWNSLPPRLRHISSHDTFKTQTKLYLLEKQSE